MWKSHNIDVGLLPESQILAHKHLLVHFNLVIIVLFFLCFPFLSLAVLRWLLSLFLSLWFFVNCTAVYVVCYHVCYLAMKMTMTMMLMVMVINCFVVWLTNKKRVALI